MKKLIAAAAFLLAAGVFAAARAATPLVDAAWVKAHLDDPEVVILDIRNKIDGGSREVYEEAHIPGAIYSDYLEDGWRTTRNGVPGMLPPVAELEKLIGGLGIGDGSHVVVVPAGVSALDMGSATRVYWTFKVLGHDAVSILDGGYAAYAADPANSLEGGVNRLPPATFEASLRPQLLAGRAEVEKALKSGVPLIDNRPSAHYQGKAKHPAAKRSGTIPGARNVPESELTVDNGGRFIGVERAAELFKAAGVPTKGEGITFCNTGHWASLGWFVAHEILGNKDVKMYDGSMTEWSSDPELPVVDGTTG